MAKRKPAIQANQGHPGGLADDILMPLADNALKLIRNSRNTKLIKKIDKLEGSKKPIKPRKAKTLDKVYTKQDKLSRRSEDGLGIGNERRRQGYENLAEKNTIKSEIAAKKGKTRKEDRYDRRESVAWAKMKAMEDEVSPRKAAVAERKLQRNAKKGSRADAKWRAKHK
jgi:hypothetical protein